MGAVPSGIIFAWPSTAASIPAGWSRVAALDGKYVRGAATAGGTGGAATHTHTSADHTHKENQHSHLPYGTSAASVGDVAAQSVGGTNSDYLLDSDNHTHTIDTVYGNPGVDVGTTAVSWQTSANDPSYWLVIWIESDGSRCVPDGALGFWADEDIPSDWTQPGNGKERFLKGAAEGNDGGGTGGGVTHTHTASAAHSHTASPHTHALMFSLPSVEGSLSGTEWPEEPVISGHHYHLWTSGSATIDLRSRTPTLQNEDMNEPVWTKLVIIENASGDDDLPAGIIAVWRGAADAVPRDWLSCDGSGDTADLNDDRFVKGVNLVGEIGDTGGSSAGHTHTGNSHTHLPATSHTHTVNEPIGGAEPGSYVRQGVLEQMVSYFHTHAAGTLGVTLHTPGETGSTTVNGASATTLPPYEDVIFIQYQYEGGISTDTNLFHQSFRAVGDQGTRNVIVEAQDLPGGPWSDPVEPAEDPGAHSPSLECLADGRLRLAVMDSAGDRQELLSTDDGETWGAA